MPNSTPATTPITLPLRSLQKALSVVLPAIEKKSSNPALSAVRLKADDGEVEFAATNGTLSVRSRVAVKGVTSQDAMLLPASRVEGYARLLEGETVTIQRSGKHKVAVRCGCADTKLALVAQGGFPFIEDGPAVGVVTIEQAALERMLRSTTFAVSEDRKRPDLRGALLEAAEGRVQIVTTDGHRLARYSIASKPARAKLLLPEAFLEVMGKTVSATEDGSCTVSATDESLFAEFRNEAGGVTLSQRVEPSKFPNYQAIIPAKAEASVRVPAASLLGAVRRCSSIADPSTHVVTMAMRPNGIRLNAADSATGETTEDVSAASSFSFPKLEASFRGQYLLDALKCVSGDVTVSFARVGATLGLWIKHEPLPGEQFEYVLMGVRVGK